MMQRNDWGARPEGISLRYMAYKLMDFCLRLWRVFRFIHLVYFLRNGVMRTIPEWLLGIEIVTTNPNAERAISFELMNRLVIWAAVG